VVSRKKAFRLKAFRLKKKDELGISSSFLEPEAIFFHLKAKTPTA